MPALTGQVAEDLRLIIQEATIRLADGKALPNITVSVGVATQQKGDDVDSLIDRVMATLTIAEDSGRYNISVGIDGLVL